MSKNKKLGLIAWFLTLILANACLFGLNEVPTATFWGTVAFVWLGFLSVLALQGLIWGQKKRSGESFLHIAPLVLTYGYMVLQIPMAIIFALGSEAFHLNMAVIIQAFLLIITWLLVIAALVGNNHIAKVNGRQEDFEREF